MYTFSKFLLLIIIHVLYLNTKAQVIVSGKINSTKPLVYKWFYPVNNYKNSDEIEQPLTGYQGKDSFSILIPVKKPSFVKLQINDLDDNFINRTEFLIIPGDTIHLKMQPYINNRNWVNFSGSNASGNKYFDSLHYRPVTKHEPHLKILKDISEGYKGDIIKQTLLISDTLLIPFINFYNQGLISKSYLDFMDSTFKVMNFSSMTFKLTGPAVQINKIDKLWRDSIVSKFFELLNPLSPNLTPLYQTSLYKNNYYIFKSYKKLNLYNTSSFSKVDTTIYGKSLSIHKEIADLLYVENKNDMEDLWALRLLMIFKWSPGTLSIKEIEDFEHLFPDSKWLPKIIKQYESNKPTIKKSLNAIDSAQIIILPKELIVLNHQFEFLTPLIKRINAKGAFIDVWASWCGPCIESFKQNSKLDSLLRQLGLIKLYISIDKDNQNNNWLNATYKYFLKGYHIRADEGLKNHLLNITNLNTISDLAIPRYLLVNLDGKVLANDLPSPLSFVDLQQALFKLIKNQAVD